MTNEEIIRVAKARVFTKYMLFTAVWDILMEQSRKIYPNKSCFEAAKEVAYNRNISLKNKEFVALMENVWGDN
jgi:hypothetical protein